MVNIQNYQQKDINQLIKLQQRYVQKYPDYIVRGKEIFNQHPAFKNGENIFCVFNNDKQIGFSAIFPQPAGDKSRDNSHKIWFDIIIDPEVSCWNKIMNLLLKKIEKRSKEIKNDLDSHHSTELGVCKFSTEIPYINFYKNYKFKQKATDLLMLKQLPDSNDPVEVSPPAKLRFQKETLKTKSQKLKYLKARNLAFPKEKMDLTDLNWFSGGINKVITITALHQNEIVGGSFFYSVGNKVGVIEDLFTIPEWRGKGIAKKILILVFKYARENNFTEIELEVVKNKKPAVNLYKSAGFEVVKEEVELIKEITRAQGGKY